MGFQLGRELRRSASRIAIAAAAAALLTGCGSAGIFGGGEKSGVAALQKPEIDKEDHIAAAAYWGAKYEANRGDTTAGLNFAQNLRMMGGARQAVAVLKDIVMKAPDNPKVMAEYGKALTSAGRYQDAIPFLARASQMDDEDWTTLSAYGVALDQSGNHTSAQEKYQAALAISASNPTIESNLAMSYVLGGRIGEAEVIFRRLVARPDATPQMRQNLAMIESMRGNAKEAEQLAREDLDAEQANNNIAVLKQLDSQNARLEQPLSQPEPQTIAPAAAPAEISAVEPAAAEAKLEQAEATLVETPATATASPGAAPVETSGTASRYQMAPIADDEQAPKPIAPKSTTTPAQDKVAATGKPTAMLRKSIDTISVAAAGE
jgi:Flp pilus assembly protein TadD